MLGLSAQFNPLVATTLLWLPAAGTTAATIAAICASIKKSTNNSSTNSSGTTQNPTADVLATSSTNRSGLAVTEGETTSRLDPAW
jgi:hypothetical protein